MKRSPVDVKEKQTVSCRAGQGLGSIAVKNLHSVDAKDTTQ